MNVQVRETKAAPDDSPIVDCDIHPALRTPADLHPFLPARWREHMATFGAHLRQGLPRPAAVPAHGGGRHARRFLSARTGRPAPTST